jgi:type IV pilus assembly protein PilN
MRSGDAEVRSVIRINLLPWREARRKAHNLQFFILMGMVAGLAASIVLLVHGYYATRIATQTERNRFLKSENTKLDKEIEEIQKLKEEIQALLSRKQVIETLQADRAQTVYLLEQLVRQTPDGVYLKSIKQSGLKVNLTGYAQSNARVSTLMRNFEASAYLANPVLVEIKAATVNNKRLSEFTMDVSIKRLNLEADAAKAGAAKGGADKGGADKAAAGAKK